MSYVFNKLNLNRLHGKTHIKNKRVIKGIEKLGFKKEGINNDYYYHQKKKLFSDAYSYSLLKRDFKKNNTIRKNKKKNNSTADELNFIIINRVISKVLKKKIFLEKNIKMNDILEWDSVNHFDIISGIEKKFNKKFSNEEILKSSSTESIYKIIKRIT